MNHALGGGSVNDRDRSCKSLACAGGIFRSDRFPDFLYESPYRGADVRVPYIPLLVLPDPLDSRLVIRQTAPPSIFMLRSCPKAENVAPCAPCVKVFCCRRSAGF